MSTPGRVCGDEGALRNGVAEKKPRVDAAQVAAMVAELRENPETRHLSANKANRLVRRFLEAGLHERDLVAWLISYADPTGETAVRNVMRGRS